MIFSKAFVTFPVLALVLAIWATPAQAEKVCPIPEGFERSTKSVQGFTVASLQREEGHALRIADHPDEVHFVNLWAVWCAPCREELPLLQQLSQRLSEGEPVRVWAVNLGDTPDRVTTLLDSLNVKQLPIAYFKDYSILRELGFVGLPATFVVTPSGELYRRVGIIHNSAQTLDAWMRCLAG